MIDVSSRPIQVFISTASEEGGLDVTDLVVGFDYGDDWLDQSGLAKCTGTLTLNGYPIGRAIDTNPRTNRERWARGNKVEIWINAGAGLELFKTLYITKEPLPPHPNNPRLQIPIGCRLSLLDYRQPPQDASGVQLGTDTSRGAIAQSLLSKAGAGTLIGTIPGTVKGPLQKLNNGSLVGQAGQVSYAGQRLLACNSSGEIEVYEIDLDPDPFLSVQVGGWNGGELIYEPSEGQEPPAETVRCTGVTYQIDRPNSGDNQDESSSVKEQWGPASVIDPDASGYVILSQDFTSDRWDENQRIIRTLRNEPVGLVFPEDEPQNPFSLISVLETREIQTYEPGDEGKLLKTEIYSRGPFGVVAKEWIAAYAANQNNLKYEWSDIKFERKRYEYDSGETVMEETETWETLAAIASTIQWETPKGLKPSQLDRRSWEKPYRGEFKEIAEVYQSISRAFPDLAQNPENPNLTPDALVGLIRTDNQSTTSNSGQTQPPAPNRRRPEFTTTEVQIEGRADFGSYAGSEFNERERTYDIPYAANASELGAIAVQLGRILQGRRLGVEWALPLTSEWKDAGPLVRLDFTEPDGSVQSYLANGISVTFDENRCYVGGAGVWRGTVKEGVIARPPGGHPTRVDYTVIGPDPVDPTLDQILYTQPPAPKAFRTSGAIAIGGSMVFRPYSSQAIAFQSSGAIGIGGSIRYVVTAFAAAEIGDITGGGVILKPVLTNAAAYIGDIEGAGTIANVRSISAAASIGDIEGDFFGDVAENKFISTSAYIGDIEGSGLIGVRSPVTIGISAAAYIGDIEGNAIANILPSTYSPEVGNYKAGVEALGGTVSNAALDVLQGIITSINSFKSKFRLLWFPVSDFTGVRVPLIGSNMTPNAYISSDWNIQTGLLGGTGRYMQTGIIGSTALTRASSHLAAWTTTNRQILETEIGASNASGEHSLVARNSGVIQGRTYDSTGNGIVTLTVADSIGFSIVNRRSLTDARVSRNNATFASISTVSSNLPGVEYYVGGTNNNGSLTRASLRRIAYASIGEGLSDTEEATLYNAIATAMTARSTL